MATTRVSFDVCNHNFLSVAESHGVYACTACGLKARKISQPAYKGGAVTWSTHGVLQQAREGVVFPKGYGFKGVSVPTRRTVRG